MWAEGTTHVSAGLQGNSHLLAYMHKISVSLNLVYGLTSLVSWATQTPVHPSLTWGIISSRNNLWLSWSEFNQPESRVWAKAVWKRMWTPIFPLFPFILNVTSFVLYKNIYTSKCQNDNAERETDWFLFVISRYLVTHLMGADLNNIVKCQKLTDDHVQFLIYQILRGLKVSQPSGNAHLLHLYWESFMITKHCFTGFQQTVIIITISPAPQYIHSADIIHRVSDDCFFCCKCLATLTNENMLHAV